MRYGPFRPSRKAIIEYFFLQNAYIAQFLIIYGFTNQRASQSESLFHLYWDFELAIPFIPEMFIVYYSINILILVPLFFLERYEFRRFYLSMVVATVIASFFFYFFPVECAYVRQIPDYEPWKTVLTQFYSYDQPYNLVPSLHIAYTTTVFLYLLPKSRGHWRTSFVVWTLAIYSSVILTHQHHLVDIAGGTALSVFVFKLIENNPTRMGPLFKPPQGT